MLTIINDPAGITGRQRHDWDFSATMQQNIAAHLDAGGDCELIINGERVNPLQDQRLDLPPQPGDQVTVARRPAGFDPLTWAVIAFIASTAVLYTLIPKIPGQNTGKESPNNSLTGQSNLARVYQAIPDVYGYRRVWPDLIQRSTTEYIDSVKYITEWLCVSRGKGTISAVQYAETPIGDIDGSSYEVFEPVPASGYPEFGTTTILDVLETFESDEVNGQELPYPSAVFTGDFDAVMAATTFTITLPDTPALEPLKSAAPSGVVAVEFSYALGASLFSESCTVLGFSVVGGDCTFTLSSSAWAADTAESGAVFNFDLLGAGLTTQGPYTLPIDSDRIRWSTVFLRGLRGSVTIKAEWWKIDGDGIEIPGTREDQDDTYADMTYDQRAYTTDVTPTAGLGRYRIEFTRQTPQIGTAGADVAKLEELYAGRYYAEKELPGITVIRVTTKATAEATGFSDRKFNLRWLRHVRELDSDTLSASRNFARSMAHIWTIAGNDITGLDTDALADINTEHGEDSELLRFDGSLDDADMSLGERMQLVAGTARCLIWRDGLRWTVTRDQARTTPEMQLDYRNLAARGESLITYAAHLPASNDGIELEYTDEDSQSKKAYVRLDITSGAPVTGASSNPKKVKLPGCATLTQAENRAQLEARRLLYQRVSLSDTALADGGLLYPGALVRWIDPNDFGGDDGMQAGEVLAIGTHTLAGDLITTSEAIDWKGETSGRILFTGEDGKHLAAPVVCYPDGPRLRLDSVPAGIYVAGSGRQLGSRYAFAVGLTSDELEAAGLYTATEVRPSSDGTVSLACANYDERLYGAD
jgi:hypothetical protein